MKQKNGKGRKGKEKPWFSELLSSMVARLESSEHCEDRQLSHSLRCFCRKQYYSLLIISYSSLQSSEQHSTGREVVMEM